MAIVIPTYRREQLLVDTVTLLIELNNEHVEIILIDQTLRHIAAVEDSLAKMAGDGRIRHIKVDIPSIPHAMNIGLLEAKAQIVLFLDDDVRPEPELLDAHLAAHRETGATLVAGRVIQPWQEGVDFSQAASVHFATLHAAWVDDFIGCNFSVKRAAALALGAFDENFVRVAYRFEAEFAHRLRQTGQRILFEPRACLHHLKESSGGTRTFGEHLRTVRPDHCVGEYYFLLRTWQGWGSLAKFVSRPLRAIRTRHHLRAPWWIPLTLAGELAGMIWAIALAAKGPRFVRADAEPPGSNAGLGLDP